MNFLNPIISMVSGLLGPLQGMVRNRWLRTLLWAAAAAAVIWFYGDIVRFGRWQPLNSDRARLTATVLIFAGWIAYNIVKTVRDRRKNTEMIGALTESPEKARDDMSAQELEQVRGRLKEALGHLRKIGGGRRRAFVYQLPWYVIIGPPGSGKSTALLNSGLKFPLANSMGEAPLQGVGGTRNCDWWFTEDAILLDTAGRYTTQDSDPEMDKKGWMGFLKLLKQYRPLQPINGAIIALSLEDVSNTNPQERLASARQIRARINELSEAFGSRFPVYVLLTKADLMAGFVQFFDGFSRVDREQVWGMTFPLDDGRAASAAPLAKFGSEFSLLQRRLDALLLERLQQEMDIERRGLIYGFPTQMALLKDPIEELLTEIFVTSKYDQRPLLRGVYFASGTQTGVPIDRVMHAMANIFGMDAPRMPSFSGQGKSYFLTRLLDSVVFAEASVVSADPRLRRRMALTRGIAAGVAATVLIACIGTWGYAFAQNRRMVADADGRYDAFTRSVAGIPTTGVDDTDFAKIVPPLDMLRDDPVALRQEVGSVAADTGLDQTGKLVSQYDTVYERALNSLMLPRVLVHLQRQLEARKNDQGFVAAALKIYLGLGGQGPVDKEFTRKFMQAEWLVLYPEAASADMRTDLDRHFAALMERPITPIALDQTLIDNSRRVISARPVAERAYAVLRDGVAASRLPAWRPVDKSGALGAKVFVRASGAPLTDGVPGLYTQDGFFDVVLPGLKAAADSVKNDQWVYGDQAPVAQGNLQRDVLQLYRNDFASKWKTLLADMRVAPVANIGAGVPLLLGLSGQDSALKTLVMEITNAVDLSPPPPDAKDEPSLRRRELLSRAGVTSPPDDFAPLRGMLKENSGQPSQMTDLLKVLDTLYQKMGRVSAGPTPSASPLQADGELAEANQALLSLAGRLPVPVDGWMGGLSGNIRRIAQGQADHSLKELWAAGGQRYCTQATAGRYPFVRVSQQDIPIDDFARLFGPNGTIDTFFTQNLRAYVETGSHPWRLKQSTGTGPAIPLAALAQFENADQIKQAFFGGGSSPSFHFDMMTGTLGPAAVTATLSMNGTVIPFEHGPPRTTTVQWPGAADQGSRLSVEPSVGTPLSYPGVWSVFRMFGQAGITPYSRDSFNAVFNVGGTTASFNVKVGTVLNPFTLRELQAFRCPAL